MLTLRKVMDGRNLEGLNENEKLLAQGIVETFDMTFDLVDAQISEQRTLNFLIGLNAPTSLLVKVKNNLRRTVDLMEQFCNGCKNYRDFYARILQSGSATDEMDSIIKSSLEVSDEVVNFLESKYN